MPAGQFTSPSRGGLGDDRVGVISRIEKKVQKRAAAIAGQSVCYRDLLALGKDADRTLRLRLFFFPARLEGWHDRASGFLQRAS